MSAAWIVHVQSFFFLNPKFQAFSLVICGSTAPFVLDLVGNSKDRLFRNTAQIFTVLLVQIRLTLSPLNFQFNEWDEFSI